MSEDLNTQQSQDNTYQDPIASTEEKPKKKSTAADVVATVVAVGVFYLFGLVGGVDLLWRLLGSAGSYQV